MIMDGESQKKNRIFADFSIETLLRKDDETSRKSWGIVQQSNFFSTSPPAKVPVYCQGIYNYNFYASSGNSDVAEVESAPEVQREEDEEFISVSDDNEETDNEKVCHAKSDNDGDGECSSSDGTFAWLTCTRFKPPKLPRSRRKSASRRNGRGPRIPFSTHQLAVLESTFVNSQYLSSDAIGRLAETLNLTEMRVKIWFQNRRARFRREKELSSFSQEFGGTSSSTFIAQTTEETDRFSCNLHHSLSPNKHAKDKQSFRHLINDLNLMAAAGASVNNVDSKRILKSLDTYRMSGERN